MIDAHCTGGISLLSVDARAVNDDRLAADLSPSGRARRHKNNVLEDVYFCVGGVGFLIRLPKKLGIQSSNIEG